MSDSQEPRSAVSQRTVRALKSSEIHSEVHDYIYAAIKDGSKLGGPEDDLDGIPPVKKRALIIGPLYKNHVELDMGKMWSMLRSTATDAMLVHKMLVNHGYDRANIRLLSDVCGGFRGVADPTRENIFSSLEWLTANTRPGDHRFFHFSGHGERMLREKGSVRSKQARRVIIDSLLSPRAGSSDTERSTLYTAISARIKEQMIPVEDLAYYNEGIVVRNGELRSGDPGPASRIMDHELNDHFSRLPPESVLTVRLQCCASGRIIYNNTKALGYGSRGIGNRPVSSPGYPSVEKVVQQWRKKTRATRVQLDSRTDSESDSEDSAEPLRPVSPTEQQSPHQPALCCPTIPNLTSSEGQKAGLQNAAPASGSPANQSGPYTQSIDIYGFPKQVNGSSKSPDYAIASSTAAITMPGGFENFHTATNVSSSLDGQNPASVPLGYIRMLEEIPEEERKVDGIRAKTVFTDALSPTNATQGGQYKDYNAMFHTISKTMAEETKKIGVLQFAQGPESNKASNRIDVLAPLYPDTAPPTPVDGGDDIWIGQTGLQYVDGRKAAYWIEILSRDHIPELVESVNLQAGGPTEASRAIRKKLKYGDVHRQLRALTILKALVENCGPKFQASFANDQLVDRIKLMSQDPMTDEQVKRKLMSVLGSWHRQFKDDPKMHTISNLYTQCGGGRKSTGPRSSSPRPHAETLYEQHQRKAEEEARLRAEKKAQERIAREEEKRKAKEEKLAAKERERKARSQPARRPFNYEVEKPKILNTVAEATQASTNLVNAIKRVNREQESITTNPQVQECLTTAKASRKQIIKYIQLAIQKEEIIGTLLETNERIIAAIQLYDKMSKSPDQDSDDEIRDRLASTAIGDAPKPSHDGDRETELEKLQSKQRARVQREISRSSLRSSYTAGAAGAGVGLGVGAAGASLHPDLQDLAWGGASSSNLQAPIQPSGSTHTEAYTNRGSLSDFSDYDSSDEETHNRSPQTAYSYRQGTGSTMPLSSQEEEDPFADPFADTNEVATPGIAEKKLHW
ncbi:VHS domain protein [Ceratobasidium sp. AG-Ba]|nr:VHS domain protein [Ceratobasidium sp. AG-Ba]